MIKRIALLLASMVGVITVSVSADGWRLTEQNKAGAEGYAAVSSPEGKVDLNVASLRALQQLPGINQELAQRIVLHRPYQKLDELVARKVLSRKEFARIKERIRVNSTPRRKGASRDIEAR